MTMQMHISPRCTANAKRTGCRCRSPAVSGFKVCRMHGARGGAPEGKRNGNYLHGGSTKETLALLSEMRWLARICRDSLDSI